MFENEVDEGSHQFVDGENYFCTVTWTKLDAATFARFWSNIVDAVMVLPPMNLLQAPAFEPAAAVNA